MEGTSQDEKDANNDHNHEEDRKPSAEDTPLAVAPPSSVHGEAGDPPVDETWNASSSSAPQKPELTLKEKLVMRERQRRIETERARLKRQFLQSGDTSSALDDSTSRTEEANIVQGVPPIGNEESMDDGGYISVEEQTLGEESMRAHPDEDEATTERLGFNMERFLRNSDTFNPQLEPMDENEEKSVLMERFLKEVVPNPPSDANAEEIANVTGAGSSTRSVSFDMDASGSQGAIPALGNNIPTLQATEAREGGPDISMQVEASPHGMNHDSSLHVEAPSSVGSSTEVAHTNDGPRMLRLTEADMLEMASIDEASIGNAPPSDRDEVMSEIGELAEFATNRNDRIGRGGSHDTPTTVLESSSQMSGGDHLQTSVGRSNASSTDPQTEQSPSSMQRHQGLDSEIEEIVPVGTILGGDEPSVLQGIPPIGLSPIDPPDIPYSNRPRRRQSVSPELHHGSPSSAHSSTNVDGFEYDKNAPASPITHDLLLNNESYGELPMNSWSAEDKMHVSPLHTSAQRAIAHSPKNTLPGPPFYGAVDTTTDHINDVESTPLLVPKQREDRGVGEYMRKDVKERGEKMRTVFVRILTQTLHQLHLDDTSLLGCIVSLSFYFSGFSRRRPHRFAAELAPGVSFCYS